MNDTKKIEYQVQFWSLLGPLFVLLTISVLLFKASPHWAFPFSAILGVPLCIRWQSKGMVGALIALFIFSFIGYQNLGLNELYWYVGLSLAIAFSLIILTLSLEEAQTILNKTQLESQSRLDNFLLLDERLREMEKNWKLEKDRLHKEKNLLTDNLEKTQEEKQTFYKIAQLARDELILIKGQHELLLQDLMYKKEQVVQLKEKLEENEITIHEFVYSNAEQMNVELKKMLESVGAENHLLKEKLVEQELAIEESQKLHQQALCQQEQMAAELQEQQEILKNHSREQQALQKKWIKEQEEKQEYFEKFGILEKEKAILANEKAEAAKKCNEMGIAYSQLQEKLTQSLGQFELLQKSVREEQRDESKKQEVENLGTSSENHKMEAIYVQLKHQFQEKSDVLDATRRELFRVNEKLMNWERESEEREVYSRPENERRLEQYCVKISRYYEKMQKIAETENQQLVELVSTLMKMSI